MSYLSGTCFATTQIRLCREQISKYIILMNKNPEKIQLFSDAIDGLKDQIKSMEEAREKGRSSVR